MRKIALSLFIGAVLAPVLHAVPASALNARSWVSGRTGNDANSCVLALPCATFQRAHDQTSPGGEIGVLTPGDFGAVTINKSIAITNDGTGEAGIQATGGNAIFIAAGAGDIISLRGLVLDGAGTGGFGITFLSGSALHVQNCVIRNFEGAAGSVGLLFGPTGTSQLFVSDTLVYNNGQGANSGGIFIQPVINGKANVVLDRVQLENNVVGLKVDGSSNNSANGAFVIVRDSVLAGNAGDGLAASTVAGKAGALVFVVDSAFVNNTNNGILANGPHGTVLVGASVIARNGTGISAVSGGQIISYQNNDIDGNLGPDSVPTGTRTQH
jgi:hypothetical protein